jgi:hypothetical protein
MCKEWAVTTLFCTIFRLCFLESQDHRDQVRGSRRPGVAAQCTAAAIVSWLANVCALLLIQGSSRSKGDDCRRGQARGEVGRHKAASNKQSNHLALGCSTPSYRLTLLDIEGFLSSLPHCLIASLPYCLARTSISFCCGHLRRSTSANSFSLASCSARLIPLIISIQICSTAADTLAAQLYIF